MERKPISNGTFKPRFHDTLSTNEIIDIIERKCKCRIITSVGKGPAVIFLPHGWDNLVASTHYGKWTSENELESQYFLEGYYSKDGNGKTTTVVTHVLTPVSASRKHTTAQLYVEGGTNAYKDLEEQEKSLAAYGKSGRVSKTGAELNPFYTSYGPPMRVGFGHTHPNLGVFFSETDKTSVFAVPGEPWVTMVVDPRREEILVTTGPDLTKSQLIIMGSEEKNSEKEQLNPEFLLKNNKINLEFNSMILPKLIPLINHSIVHDGTRFEFKVSGKLPGRMKLKGTFCRQECKKN